MTAPCSVTLTCGEIMQAAQVGVMRRVANMALRPVDQLPVVD